MFMTQIKSSCYSKLAIMLSIINLFKWQNYYFSKQLPMLAFFCILFICNQSIAQNNCNWKVIASENGSYQLKEQKLIRYGANGKFVYKTLSGNQTCNNATFGDPVPGVVKKCYSCIDNIALGKTSRQSSNYAAAAGLSKSAVDGNTNGRWTNKSVTHTRPQSNPWWEVDLGQVYDIERIKIWNRTDCCRDRLRNFYIMASPTPITANSTSQNLYIGSAQSFGGQDFLSFSKKKKARYIRIFIQGSNKILSLAEVEVYQSAGFYMAFASDSQWAWTDKTGKQPESTSEKERGATILNENHVKSINKLTNDLGTVRGLIMNGDLTAYGHPNEFSKFKSIYNKIQVPMYTGLGNHDYANNIDDTYENHAANRMVEYMVSHIKSNGATNSDYKVSNSYVFPNIVTTITGSLSYSWDIGNVHFVQLQNYPIYEREWSNFVSTAAKRKTVKITSALKWLKADLAKARRAGKVIILNYHDSDEHWNEDVPANRLPTLAREFSDMLTTYKVGAVFVGHYHESLGKRGIGRPYPNYGNTPLFYCGSASHSKYLLVNFNGDKMKVTHVSSKDGKATLSNEQEYTVFNKAVAVTVPKADGQITFFNEAGYVARYSLTYNLNGQSKSFSTGNIALGNKKRYKIPSNATNIRVKGEGKTGLVWEPWRITFEKSYSGVITKCFKSYGTTLNQKWNNNCN